MNVNVQVSTAPNETLTRTPQELANAILEAVGGDPTLDTVSVTASAMAGLPVAMPGLPGVEPPKPRTI